MSEAAPSVGGGATIDSGSAASTAGIGTPDQADPIVGRIVAASQAGNPSLLLAELDAAAAVLGLRRCVEEIVMPATRRLSPQLPAAGTAAQHDQVGTEAIRTWLGQRSSAAPPPREAGPILLACAPREPLSVGLEALAVLLRWRRWPCWVLGGRVSTVTLTVAAQASGAAGVIVLSTQGRGFAGAVESLRAVDALGVPVFFVGGAFAAEAVRQQLPGRYLGAHWGTACDLVIDALQAVPTAGSDQPTSGVQPREWDSGHHLPLR